MKKIIICCMLLSTVLVTFSQQTTSLPSLTKQDYLQKSKHQKTAAWLLIGSGVVLSTTSLILIATKGAEDIINIIPVIFTGDPAPQNDYTTENILLTIGGAAILSSIPLFIASGKNKGKSMSLSFKNDTAPQFLKNNLTYKSIPIFKP